VGRRRGSATCAPAPDLTLDGSGSSTQRQRRHFMYHVGQGRKIAATPQVAATPPLTVRWTAVRPPAWRLRMRARCPPACGAAGRTAARGARAAAAEGRGGAECFRDSGVGKSLRQRKLGSKRQRDEGRGGAAKGGVGGSGGVGARCGWAQAEKRAGAGRAGDEAALGQVVSVLHTKDA
jgi:hypothetical protein